jgi:hypothetical protein
VLQNVQFNWTLSTVQIGCCAAVLLKETAYRSQRGCINMKRKNAILVTEDDLLTDLAFHNVPPSLLIEFSEKIVRPCYGGSITAAIKDLFQKALSGQETILASMAHA